MPNIEFFKIKERCKGISGEDVYIINLPTTRPWKKRMKDDIRGYNVFRIIDATAQASAEKFPCAFMAEFASYMEMEAFNRGRTLDEYYKGVEYGMRRGEAAMRMVSCNCNAHHQWRLNQMMGGELQQQQALNNNENNPNN